jgi:hypothetical protein
MSSNVFKPIDQVERKKFVFVTDFSLLYFGRRIQSNPDIWNNILIWAQIAVFRVLFVESKMEYINILLSVPQKCIHFFSSSELRKREKLD